MKFEEICKQTPEILFSDIDEFGTDGFQIFTDETTYDDMSVALVRYQAVIKEFEFQPDSGRWLFLEDHISQSRLDIMGK